MGRRCPGYRSETMWVAVVVAVVTVLFLLYRYEGWFGGPTPKKRD